MQFIRTLQKKAGKDTSPRHKGHSPSPKEHALHTQPRTCPHSRSIIHPSTFDPTSKHTAHSRLSTGFPPIVIVGGGEESWMGGGNPRGMVSSPLPPGEARGSFVPGGGEVGKGGGGRHARGRGHAGTSVSSPSAYPDPSTDQVLDTATTCIIIVTSPMHGIHPPVRVRAKRIGRGSLQNAPLRAELRA